MKINETSMALMSFAENYVFSHITDEGTLFTSYMLLFIALPKIELMIQQNIGMLEEIGVVAPDGTVNIELLKDAGLKTFEKMQTVKVWKFTFDKNDFEKFIEHINR